MAYEIAIASNNEAPFSWYAVEGSGTPITRSVELTQDSDPEYVTSAVLTAYLVFQVEADQAKVSAVDADAGVVWEFSKNNSDWFADLTYDDAEAESVETIYIRCRVLNDGTITTNRTSAKIKIEGWGAGTLVAIDNPLFFWTCQGTTLDSTHDFSAGATTATASGEGISISSDAGIVGTNGVYVETVNRTYDIVSTDIIPNIVGEGAIGFVFHIGWDAGRSNFSVRGAVTWMNSISISSAVVSAAEGLKLIIDSYEGEVHVSNSCPGVQFPDGNLDAVYGVVSRWNSTTGLMRTELYDDQGELITSAQHTDGFTVPAESTYESFRFGYNNRDGDGGKFSNLIICDYSDAPIQDYLFSTSFTEWGT